MNFSVHHALIFTIEILFAIAFQLTHQFILMNIWISNQYLKLIRTFFTNRITLNQSVQICGYLYDGVKS